MLTHYSERLGKGVVVDVWGDDRMPVDADGNVADIIMHRLHEHVKRLLNRLKWMVVVRIISRCSIGY